MAGGVVNLTSTEPPQPQPSVLAKGLHFALPPLPKQSPTAEEGCRTKEALRGALVPQVATDWVVGVKLSLVGSEPYLLGSLVPTRQRRLSTASASRGHVHLPYLLASGSCSTCSTLQVPPFIPLTVPSHKMAPCTSCGALHAPVWAWWDPCPSHKMASWALLLGFRVPVWALCHPLPSHKMAPLHSQGPARL